jgi:hypothetical protein
MEQISTVEYQKKFTEHGYIKILVNNKWIPEHRFVVSEFIGRELTEEEKVHHINFCKMDNRIDNLYLFDNQKDHKSFENKFNQFGLTNNLKNQIKHRWDKYEKKRN